MASLTLPTLTINLNASFSPFGISSPFISTRYHPRGLKVACTSKASRNAGDGPNKENVEISSIKFDRRNLLLGIGGLSGATATIFGANSFAAISDHHDRLTPDFAHCVDAQKYDGGGTINCCPPSAKDIRDYVPSATKSYPRPAAHLVDGTYIKNYEKAIAKMKSLPLTDSRNFTQQANVHCAYCNGGYYQQGQKKLLEVHKNWLFFPFHRWFLYFFERICQNLLDDDTFVLPFWNWDDPDGMVIPTMFSNVSSPLYDRLRDARHFPPTVVDLDFSDSDPHPHICREEQMKKNLKTMHKQMVAQSTTPILFFGSPFYAGDDPNPGAGTIEQVPHNLVHDWTGDSRHPPGEDMGALYSAARDPIFYSHHSNVDRMWNLWIEKLGGKNLTDKAWLDSTFIFYNEEAKPVRVKIRDGLDTKKLGYVYQDVRIQWLDDSSKPTPRRKAFTIASAPEARKLFPKSLEGVTSVVVKRPKKSRSKREKDETEEVLLIEGIDFNAGEFVKFDVYVNEDRPELSGPDKTEFIGSFVNVSHGHSMTSTTNATFALTKVLKELEADDYEDILVTLVPRKGTSTVKGIKIVYDDSKVNP